MSAHLRGLFGGAIEMEVGKYTLHRRAMTALHQLPGDEQAAVLENLASLVTVPVADWPSFGVKKLPAEAALYLFNVNDSLRAILSAADGQQPEILDIVRHETLQSFAQAGP
jgi:hypothetical protein